MAVTVNSTGSNTGNKVPCIKKANVSFGSQNDVHVITHANDELGARSVNIYDVALAKVVAAGARFEVKFTSETTTTIKNLTAGPETNIGITVTVPVNNT